MENIGKQLITDNLEEVELKRKIISKKKAPFPIRKIIRAKTKTSEELRKNKSKSLERMRKIIDRLEMEHLP